MGGTVGVCYGMLGNNLPQPADVVGLYKANNIRAMRLYAPNQAALQALRGSNIQLVMDVGGELQSLASSTSTASSWVQNNVLAYWPDVSFKYITAGNEVIPGNQAQYVLPAMRNIQGALSAAGLQDKIKVSTSVSTGVLGSSYPPSTGAFSPAAQTYLNPIVQFLANNGAPLLVNVYPYFSYVDNPTSININYALFTSPGTVVTDGQYNYQNLFDAIVDATYAALEKVGGTNVPIVVSESGWPSAGGTAASISNAQTYNQNLIKHVSTAGATPRRSGKPLEVYIFAMFNENQKSPGIEQNWGLFYPSKQPVYPISFSFTGGTMGVCYGMLGNNLPPPADVVSLYKANNIRAMRLYAPNQAAFQALRGSNIQLILDVGGDLQSLASSSSNASSWVQNNVRSYWPDVAFKYIAVGNEVIPGDQAQYVLPAMRNVQSALSAAGLQDQIKVSTSVSTVVLGSSYPPSAGAFSSAAQQYLSPIVQFLANNGAPFLINIYPYFSYIGNPSSIDIKYALFTSPGTVVTDGQYNYQNLFDAVVDATYAALEKVGGANVPIVVSESGWPSAGGTATSISNAQTYNQNLIKHVANAGATPRRPGKPLEVYIFAMFNENQKSSGIEQNWGLFYPNKQPVYPITFSK